MQIYKELKELAVMCAYNARISTSIPVAVELWNMAKEYQRKAAHRLTLMGESLRKAAAKRQRLDDEPAN
jgi:hypothetical protein